MKQQRKHWEKKRITKEGKTNLWEAEIDKGRQNKKKIFLKWLSTKDNNYKVQYKMVQTKIRRMVPNHSKKFLEKKCLEIQSYLGSKKSSGSWKIIKNIRPSNNGKRKLNKS